MAKTDGRLRAERRKTNDVSTGDQAAGGGGERAAADPALGVKRARADVTSSGDRKAQADALAALLVHEQAVTDAYLLTERARSDDAIAHHDDFLAMVADDVRNLLNLVGLNLDLLRPSDEAGEPDASAAASRIRRYIARMNCLIGDLVDITSIEGGKLAMTPGDGDAAALMAEAVRTFQPAALAKGIVLDAEVRAGPLLARFDHDRMLQVLANLISNSLKFTPRGGHVTLREESVPGMLGFCVSDSGVGLPAPIDAIFERFWKVGKNDQRGLGLGLYISKSIVEAHGGRIWATSQPGQGSQLHFTLPLPSNAVERADLLPENPHALRNDGPTASDRRRRDPPGVGVGAGQP